MKKIILVSAILVSFFSSCSNDFEVASSWKEISVVYGLLDFRQPTNYLRIEKAFLDESTSAVVMAASADTIYHQDELEVVLMNMKNNHSWLLEKVDGDTIGLSRPAGVFANKPNILYRLTSPVERNGYYKLRIKNLSTGKIDSAFTNIVDTIRPNFPMSDITIPIPFNYNPNGSNNDLPFKWMSAPKAVAYDLSMQFIYHEVAITNPTVTVLTDTVELPIFKNLYDEKEGLTSSLMTYEYFVNNFYTSLSAKLDAKPGYYRIFDQLDFTMTYGGKEFYEYYTQNNLQTGIVADQILPQYTNILGGNYSRGVFSSRVKDTFENFTLDSRTKDSLVCGQTTKHLGFVHSALDPSNTCN